MKPPLETMVDVALFFSMLASLLVLWRFRHKAYYRLIYLRSAHWKSVKARRRKISKGICEVAGCFETKVDAHHIAYERLGHELTHDIVDLCRRHHNATHNGLHLKLKNGKVLKPFVNKPYLNHRRI